MKIVCNEQLLFKLLTYVDLEIVFLGKKFNKGIITKNFRNINRELTLELTRLDKV